MVGIDFRTRIGWSSALTIALAMLASPAVAQGAAQGSPTSTADPAAATADEEGAGLEEIIVTAQRRAENIQDVSIAIQAITAEGLAKSGITDVSRLELVSPGVTYARYGTDAKISLRGANSNNTFLDASPSVGAFVDGVYRPRAAQQTRSFFDVERLEILKGPQGTLYGRNTLAGAVNLYTIAADPDEFAAGVTATYARFNTVRGEGYVNVPISGNLAVRVAGLIERGDGWVENLAGEDLGNPDTVSGRVSLRYEADEGGDITLRLSKIRERGNQTGLFAFTGRCRSVTAQGLTDPFGTSLDCRNPRRGSAGSRRFDQLERLQVLKDFVHEDRIDEFNATLEINSPFVEGFGLKGIFSYTDFDLDLGQDSDFSEIQVSADFLRERVKSYTGEVQLSSDNDSPFQFTVGVYGSRDEIDFLSGAIRFTRDNQGVRPQVPVPPFAGPCPPPAGSGGTCLPRLDPTPVISPVIDLGNPNARNAAGQPTREGQSSNNFQYTSTTSLGLFGQASYEIIDGLRLVGGVRYSRDEKSALNYGGPTAGSTLQGPQFPTSIPRTIDAFAFDPSLAIRSISIARDYENVTYRAAIEYDVNPDVLLFASYGTGFLSGSLSAAGTSTDDQKSSNYEFGIKSRFLDDRVQINASVYFTEYTNLITSFQRPNNSGGVDTLSINGGDIESKGAEAVIEARPIDNLRLTLGISYLDSKFGTFGVLAPHQLVNGNPAASGRFIDLSGIRPQYAPEWQASLVGAYDFDLPGDGGTITPQVQFYYSAEYSAQTQLSLLDRAGTQDGFTKTDLRLSYTTADERFGLEVFLENLEDEIVLQRVTYGGDGIEQTTYGYPRNYGVRARARF